jgi:hypothetical protein
MIIDNEEPVVIPPSEPKVYPHLWIETLIINAPTPQTGSLLAELMPFNAETQEVGPSEFKQVISLNNLWQAVQEVPEVAHAFQAILSCVGPVKTWQASQPVPEIISRPILTRPITTSEPIE